MAQQQQQQQQQQQTGKPVPFISIVQDEEKNTKFELQNDAISMLQQYKDYQIAILVIAGPQRTGKSFLANRLLKQMKGFAIGPTTQPCTKGIWIWDKPVQLNKKTMMFILDTEGLNSVQRDKTIDMKIFSISMLLCSMFVYNNIGHIDEVALENISLVTKLSENICIQNTGENDNKIGEYLPHFYWVLRDFSLDLKEKSPKQYLDGVLKPVPGEGIDIQRKNDVREKLRNYFVNRDCECMVRPLIDEKKLARIEEQDWQSLRPEFRSGVETFERKIYENIQPKTIQNKILNCEMFISLTYEYLQAINSGGVPTILSTLDILVEQQLRKVRDDIHNQYQKQLEKMVPQGKMPFDENDILQKKSEIIKMLSFQLEQKVKHFIDIDKLQVLKSDFMKIIEEDFKLKLQQNALISKNIAIQCMQQFNTFPMPVFNTVEQMQPNMVSQKYEEMVKLLNKYDSTVQGGLKYKIFFQQFPKWVFDYFDKMTDRIRRVYDDDQSKIKIILEETRQREDLVRKTKQNLEQHMTKLQSDADKDRRELQKNKRDFVSYKELQEEEIKSLKLQLEKYQNENYDKYDSDQRNNNMSQFNEEQSNRLKQQLTLKNQEIETLELKVDELEKLIFSLKENQNCDENTVGAVQLLKSVKTHVGQMENYYSKKTNFSKDDSSHFNTYIKNLEDRELEKQELIAKTRAEYQAKKEEYRKKLEGEQQKYDKKIDVLNKYIDSIKSEMYQLQSQNEQIQLKDQQIKNLLQENQNYQTAISSKSQNLETHSQALAQQKLELEKIINLKSDLEIKLGYMKVDITNLECLKSDYPYVLEQSLKYVLNKKSQLKHSLKSLEKEDREAIQEVFQRLSINLNF